MNLKRACSLFGLGLFLFAQVLFAQTELDYQNRGNRFEGIKPKPVSGFDLELISVLADHREQSSSPSDQLRVKFYLESTADVHLTVREQDYKFFYWLDQVKPAKQWERGFTNEFVWPTETVLRRLFDRGLKLDDLGVLIRLGNKVPSSVERVAPAVLYFSHAPQVVQGYLFTLKTGGDAKVRCSIYKEGKFEPILTQVFQRIRGGRPFTAQWDASAAEPGEYRLAVSGYLLDNNHPLNQMVRFYHQPAVK